jgi:hypothetical protein
MRDTLHMYKKLRNVKLGLNIFDLPLAKLELRVKTRHPI